MLLPMKDGATNPHGLMARDEFRRKKQSGKPTPPFRKRTRAPKKVVTESAVAEQVTEKDGRIRIQRFISQTGFASRREAERLIRAGKVRVNGQKVTELGTKVDPIRDSVQVGNKRIHTVTPGLVIFNKPRNVVSTMNDPEGRPCVADYLTPKYRSYYPVGRLDWETTGLLLLTNDGELAQHLMHPSYEFDRAYQVRIKGKLTELKLAKIEKGIKLIDGIARAEVRVLRTDEESAWLEMIVRQGKNRVIRRMMEALELEVLKLKRVRYGPFKIGTLQPGEMRLLSEPEYLRIRKTVLSREKRPKAEGEP
jgi:23S rRNA pseudouridine2605 synthase